MLPTIRRYTLAVAGLFFLAEPAAAQNCDGGDKGYLSDDDLEQCIQSGQTLRNLEIRGDSLARAMSHTSASVKIDKSTIFGDLHITNDVGAFVNPAQIKSACKKRYFLDEPKDCQSKNPVAAAFGDLEVNNSVIGRDGEDVTVQLFADYFAGNLILQNTKVNGDIRLSSGIVAGRIALVSGTELKGAFGLMSIVVNGDVDLSGVVADTVFFTDGTSMTGAFSIRNAEVNELSLWYSRFSGGADFSHIQIHRQVIFRTLQFDGASKFDGTSLSTGDVMQKF